DRAVSTGCEVDISSSTAHCGGCGLACAPGQTCATGRCVSNTGLPIGVGAAHVCAVQADGSVVCWGLNSSSQLGDGTTTSRAA
ncbi:hypothetical protein, partial [Salmonella enterica]|uniref:hypothetical protein n=1 Tax=Salmonella enterica TaxID=28901 RepID=UPI003297F259